MPHFILDCSESILRLADPDELMRSVHVAAASTNLFPRSGTGSIQIRLNTYRYYVNGDGHEHFVHVFATLMEGRTQKQKQQLSAAIVRSLRKHLPTVDTISVNVQAFEKPSHLEAPATEVMGGTSMAVKKPIDSQPLQTDRRRNWLTHWPVSPAWVIGSKSGNLD